MAKIGPIFSYTFATSTEVQPAVLNGASIIFLFFHHYNYKHNHYLILVHLIKQLKRILRGYWKN